MLLAGSLAANVALGFLVCSQTGRTLPANRPVHAATASDAGGAFKKPADAAADPQTWGKLGGGDAAELAARLRAEGFPPLLQRAILTARIHEQFAEQRKALDDLIAGGDWWRDNFGYTANNAKIRIASRHLEHDERDALDAVLDPSVGLTDYARARQIHRYGDRLPLAKTLAIDRLEDDYADMDRDVRDAVNEILRPEDSAKLQYLDRQKRADLEQLLTSDELVERDLHASGPSRFLAERLAAFDPSEDEFRAIFKIHQASLALANGPNPLKEEDRRASEATQLAAALAPERYAEYQQKTDPAYVDAHAVIERLQLPETATADVVAVKNDIGARADVLRRDTSLTADERNQRLAALEAEAVARLTPTLGDTGMAVYLKMGGYWLKALKSPPEAKH